MNCQPININISKTGLRGQLSFNCYQRHKINKSIIKEQDIYEL